VKLVNRLRHPMPFYRSPVTRWAFVGTGLFLAYAFSPAGPAPWRDTPSLHWLHEHYLPWPVLSCLFVVYAVLAACRPVGASISGAGLGLVLYAWEFIALCATTRSAHPTNPFVLAAVVLAAVLHFAALRLAVIQALNHDQETT
jgi:hypothetical protein